MTHSDLLLLQPDFATLFDTFWSYTTLEAEFHNPNSRCFVAKIQNQIVGFAGIWISVDDVHITNIVIEQSHRQQGIGSVLLESLLQEAKLTQKASLTLEVNEHNTAAIHLYEKYHFTLLGRRKNYYAHNEDALIMTYYF